MNVEKIILQACCGKTAVIFKTDQPVTKLHLEALQKLGFIELSHFTEAGLLYVDNPDFTITGPFGADRLTVKCKHADKSVCTEKTNDLEVLFQQLG
jgi:hypothetical protein